jgi:hypothetical protein
MLALYTHNAMHDYNSVKQNLMVKHKNGNIYIFKPFLWSNYVSQKLPITYSKINVEKYILLWRNFKRIYAFLLYV